MTEAELTRAIRFGIVLAVSDLIGAGVKLALTHAHDEIENRVLTDVLAAREKLLLDLAAMRVGGGGST
jgi:hypothetical protein